MTSYFLPQEVLPIEKILEQKKYFENSNVFKEIIEFLPYPILVLNSYRQIVFYNEALKDNFQDLKNKIILGLRPGNALKCKNAISEDGCGTTIFCRTCGAAKAIVASLAGRNDIQECRITTFQDEAYDFRVWTYPRKINNEMFTVFTLNDISHEKRRELLERIFYHDLLNTANGIIGLLEIYNEADEDEKAQIIKTSLSFSKITADEIHSQRVIYLAETEELQISLGEFNLKELVIEILTLYKNHALFKNIEIELNIPENVVLVSDKTILRRVIVNLVKNAIEASLTNSFIRISANQRDDLTEIKVFNLAVMPEEVKLQIFKRSFSTKGKGRGLGTYSIKLLTEKYLKGSASFISEENFGTEFIIVLPNLDNNSIHQHINDSNF